MKEKTFRYGLFVALILIVCLSLSAVSAADMDDAISEDSDIILSSNDDVIISDLSESNTGENVDLDSSISDSDIDDSSQINDEDDLIVDDKSLESTPLKDEGTTIYVSKNGSPDNDGLTEETAVNTIGAAYSKANNGFTIHIGAGAYDVDSIEIRKSLTFVGVEGTILTHADHSSRTMFRCTLNYDLAFQNIEFNNNYNDHGMFSLIDRTGTITFDNCTFKGSSASDSLIVLDGGNINTSFNNCIFTDMVVDDYMCIIESPKNITLSNCVFKNITLTEEAAMLFFGQNAQVYNCNFTNISGILVEDCVLIYILESKNIEFKQCNFEKIFEDDESNFPIFSFMECDGECNITYCNFIECGENIILSSESNVIADYNYWGTNENPSNLVDGVTISNWVIMSANAESDTVGVGDSITITADFSKYTDGSTVSDLTETMAQVPLKFTNSESGFGSISDVVWENNKAIVTYTGITEGNDIVTVSVANNAIEIPITVLPSEKIGTVLSIVVDDVVVGESSNIVATLTDDEGNPLNGTVNVTVGDKEYPITVVDGKGSVSTDVFDEIGTKDVIAKFEGNSTMEPSEAISQITIYGPGNVTVKHTDAGDAEDIQAAIDVAEPGNVIQLGNYNYTNVSNVNITKDLTITSDGASITSSGDGTPIFNVPAKSENGPDSVNITGIDFKVNNGDVIVKATADNDTSNPLSIDTQSISITGNVIEAANENVVPESVTVLKLESERGVLAPTNPITVSGNTMDAGIGPFAFDVTSIASGSDINITPGPIAPERTETQIVYENMTTTAVDVPTDGRIGEYFVIKLVDKDGTPLANRHIQIGFNGNVYDRDTNENGTARLQINLQAAGTYTFAVSYLGDDEYNGSFVVAKIVVNKQKGSLNVPNKSYSASASTKSLTATFKSASGKVVSGKKITFTVNGKTYSATTNDKGVATVKVSLNTKGTYSFTAKFAGNNMYAAISKSAKLTIK